MVGLSPASAMSLASSVSEITEENKSEQKSNQTMSVEMPLKRPNWWECDEFMIDMNMVMSVQTWCYLRSTGTPRGVRFILYDGRKIDTPEMSSDRARREVLSAKNKLKYSF